MPDIYEEDISWNSFVHQYYWVLVLLIVLGFILIGILLWYIRYCSFIMNLYYIHFRKKDFGDSELPGNKHDLSLKKNLKRSKAKNTCNIHQLALEHALAYFNKPWDYYLRDEDCDKSYATGKKANLNKSSAANLSAEVSGWNKNPSMVVQELSTPYVQHKEKGDSKEIKIDAFQSWKNFYRREPRYEYTALADESFVQERLEMGRKLMRDSDRNMSTICCQYYLRGSNRYVFLQHLPEIGSRVGKNWFLVRDTTTKTERLLTMTPVVETCPIRYSSQMRQVLLELFLAIQHPYIYPVLDIDRKIIMDQEYVVAVLPFNNEGTLKDMIYQSQCQDEWKDKYHFHGYGLGAAQIQRLGCQILEAMLFLRDQKFPPFLHLHAGNVVVQNGVARIAGLENTLFGYSSRLLTLVPKRLHDNKEAVEVVSFGHLIFEMASGYELTGIQPTEKNYRDIEYSPLVVDVLKFIFEQGRYRYPSLRQIANLEFFRHIDLRELRSLTPMPSIKTRLSSAALSLLKDVKRSQRSKKHGKSSQSMSRVETASVNSRQSQSSEASSSSKSKFSRKKKKHNSDVSNLIDSQCSGQLLKTMPLSEIETSAASNTTTLVEVDDLPPTNRESPHPAWKETDPERIRTHSLLLLEIQKGFQLRKTNGKKDHFV